MSILNDPTFEPFCQILISVGFYVCQLGKYAEMRGMAEAVNEVTWKRSLGSGSISTIYGHCDAGLS